MIRERLSSSRRSFERFDPRTYFPLCGEADTSRRRYRAPLRCGCLKYAVIFSAFPVPYLHLSVFDGHRPRLQKNFSAPVVTESVIDVGPPRGAGIMIDSLDLCFPLPLDDHVANLGVSNGGIHCGSNFQWDGGCCTASHTVYDVLLSSSDLLCLPGAQYQW